MVGRTYGISLLESWAAVMRREGEHNQLEEVILPSSSR